MVNSVKIRVGPNFYRLTKELKAELQKNNPHADISSSKITDGIADFWEKENLNKVALPRAQRKMGRGGLFN